MHPSPIKLFTPSNRATPQNKVPKTQMSILNLAKSPFEASKLQSLITHAKQSNSTVQNSSLREMQVKSFNTQSFASNAYISPNMFIENKSHTFKNNDHNFKEKMHQICQKVQTMESTFQKLLNPKKPNTKISKPSTPITQKHNENMRPSASKLINLLSQDKDKHYTQHTSPSNNILKENNNVNLQKKNEDIYQQMVLENKTKIIEFLKQKNEKQFKQLEILYNSKTQIPEQSALRRVLFNNILNSQIIETPVHQDLKEKLLELQTQLIKDQEQTILIQEANKLLQEQLEWQEQKYQALLEEQQINLQQ